MINRETHGATDADVAYLNVPFFWSTDGWGLIIETGAVVTADLGATNPAVAQFETTDDAATVTHLQGSPAAMIAGYVERTGRVGDWPDWAFGTWMSRATYVTAEEMHAALDELRAEQCPVSVMHVDAWMSGNVFRDFTTNWTVDRARFPAGWTDALRARGVRVSLWLNPFVLAGSALGTRLHDDGLLLRDARGNPACTVDRDNRWIVDFTNPAAVAWWKDRIRELLGEERPDALKLDFGEEVPLDAVSHDGRKGIEIRNSYAAMYHRATADAIPEHLRPFPFFCRSGCAGSQSTPCHWVGDTPSTWNAMTSALTACLSLSLSGFALVAHDAGGFSTPGTSRIPAALLDAIPGAAPFTADVEPELFGRWAQWAAFTPVTRFHGLGLREPTAYPEPWRTAAISALRFRERYLRPVLKRALADAQRSGVPMMRPMVLAYPDNTEAPLVRYQYLLGDDVLVAPVLERGGRVQVWFPPGEWIPLLGAPRPNGSGWQTVVMAPDAFPVYAKLGSPLSS